MTKLLIVYHMGAALSSRGIFEALAKDCSIDLTVVVPSRIKMDRVYDPSGWLTLSQAETAGGYDMIPLPLRDPSDYRRGFEPGLLRKLIAGLKPDIIHVFDEVTSCYLRQIAWMRLTAAPDAQVLFYGFNNLPISLRRRLEGWLFWPLIAGGAVASQDALRTVRQDGFPSHRPIEHIFWGIPTNLFRPLYRQLLTKELGLEHGPRIGYVGRVVPEKGIQVFRDAFQRLPASVQGLIIGSGPLRGDLEQWSNSPENKGRIRLVDPLPASDLVKYLNCLDALVLPSLTTPEWKEQYGRVLAEAMACGVPVIGSDSGAIPEVIGEAGLIVPEGDAPALAEAMQRVLSDANLQANLKARARARAETELSTTAMTRHLTEFYARLARPNGLAWRHVRHPLRSVRSLIRKTTRRRSQALARRQFLTIRRGQVERCWCGGSLRPFPWHASYAICNDCGCYVNRQPPLAEELQRFYSFDVFWHRWYKMKGIPTIENRAAVYRADGRLKYWLKLIARYGPPQGCVVEIGCSPGVLLAELQGRGYECIGLEPDEKTAAWIREHTGVDARAGYFPNVELPPADLLLAFDVLEHVPHPEAFVNGVAALLKPGGIAILQAPIDRYGKMPPFQDHFDVFDDIEHLHVFTDRALMELARRAGLEIINQTERFRPIHEVCILRKPRAA